LGNTKPVLLSSAARLITYAMPVIWLSARPEFRIEHVWYVSIVTTTLQAGLSLWLLRLEFRKRLMPLVLMRQGAAPADGTTAICPAGEGIRDD
jgi:Na+-driven multidrug efflux pump